MSDASEDMDEHVSIGTVPVCPVGKSDLKQSIGVRSKLQVKHQLEKRIRAQERKEQTALLACTFSPKVNPASRRRSLDEFLEDVNKNQRLKEQKIKEQQDAAAIKEKEELQKHTFRPQIGPQSSRPHRGPRYLQLYEQSRSTPRNLSTDFMYTFVPQISEVSKQLKRPERVDKALYKDALRRRSKDTASPDKTLPPMSDPSQALRRLFRKEYQKTCSEAGLESTATVEQLQNLLQKLGFIDCETQDSKLTSDIWQWLQGSEQKGISLQMCGDILSAIMAIAKPSSSVLGTPLRLGHIQGGKLHFSANEIAAIHREYAVYWRLRKEKHKKHYPSPSPLKFQPQTNSATMRRSKSQECFCDLSTDRRNQKLEAQRLAQEEDALKECTFAPKLSPNTKALVLVPRNTNTLSDKYKGMQTGSRTDRLYELSKEEVKWRHQLKTNQENGTEHYSFKPTLNRRKLTSDALPPKGATAVISRLTKARDQEACISHMRNQGFTFSSTRPVAHIRVKIRDNVSGQISIFPDADLVQTVHDFALLHSNGYLDIPQDEETRLLIMIRNRLQVV